MSLMIVDGVAPRAIPLGATIPWMSAAAFQAQSQTPPVGWELCDGTVVSTTGSPLLGFPKPDMMGSGKFIRGMSNPTTVVGGATAHPGAGDVGHTHTVNGDTDPNDATVAVQSGAGTTVAADPHSHPVSIVSSPDIAAPPAHVEMVHIIRVLLALFVVGLSLA